MAYEFVRFTSTNQLPRLRTMAGGPAIIAFLAGWIFGGLSTGFFWAVVVLMIGSLFWFVKRNKAVYEAAKSDLSKRGYNVDFQVGNALIDSRAKIIAFVDLASCTYDLYSAGDILGWEHQWVNHTEVTSNVWRTQANSTTRQTRNEIVFKTNNPGKPLYKVPVTSYRAGEEWMARLGAIING